MSHRPLTWLRRKAGLLRLAVLAVALACQVSADVPVASGQAPSPIALLKAATVFCQGDAGRNAPKPHHHMHVSGFAVLAGAVQPGMVPDQPPVPPAPVSNRIGVYRPNAARAPPAHFAAGFSARAPPLPV